MFNTHFPYLSHFIVVLAFGLLINLPATATNPNDLDSLLHYLSLVEQYDAAREQRISSAEELLRTGGADKYRVYSMLFEECKSYQYEQAMRYAERLMDEATLLDDPDKKAEAMVHKAFVYLSAGLFKEGYDMLQHIDTTNVSRYTRIYYHLTFARLLYDLADYDHVDMSSQYNQQGDELMQQALTILLPNDTALYWRCQAMLDQHHGQAERAIKRYQLALQDTRIDEHVRAIYYSTMAYLYSTLDNPEEQQHYNILATISDVKSSTKETVALRSVAERLFEEGNVDLAAQLIRHAESDASFFGARHRQVEISQILPIIEQENINRLRAKNNRIVILMTALFIAFLITLTVMILLARKHKQVLQARKTIEDMNESLLVANKIKEEYIGSFLCWQSDFITEVQKYQRHVRRAAEQRKLDDLQQVPKQVDAIRRREDFYHRFDEMFLRIFPTFVADFNALLRPQEAIVLREGELLNTDLRIFALMRLGITHNEVIADVLDYSVNTIYTYKTKVKNKSDLNNEAFMEEVMKIPSFNRNKAN